MHSTMSIVNLCQFKVSGNEIEYNKVIRKELQTRPNVTLSIEEYHQLSYKFVAQKPVLSPTIQVNIKLDIKAYKAHSPIEDHDDKGVREEVDQQGPQSTPTCQLQWLTQGHR